MIPAAEGGPDTIDNAIPVCFECHAEIHSYNDKHPRGRKFRPEELRGHKEQWLKICEKRPEIFVNAAREADVGPIQGMIDELEFNAVAVRQLPGGVVSFLCDDQFKRAMKEGAISTLNEELKKSVLEAYAAIGRANLASTRASNHAPFTGEGRDSSNDARRLLQEAEPYISQAHQELLVFLSAEN